MEMKGARAETRYTSLATMKFFSGLQTQRSPFAGIDTRYGSQFLGGRPDALIAGNDCEISNKLTIQRRPGLLQYGTASIPAPLAFYDWEQAAPPNITLMVDTATGIYNYSTTSAGLYLNKALQAGQTNFYCLTNTLYLGDGVDLFKIVGPNLLTQSNSFSTAFWSSANVTLLGGQLDPNGGLLATQLSWLSTGPSAFIFQQVTPNFIPVGSNSFTASIWLKQTGAPVSVTLVIRNQSGIFIANQVINVTSTWTRYQVTGTMNPGDTSVGLDISSPTTVTSIGIYGAQLEVGGPITPMQITTTQPQGVYRWGIVGPNAAPTLSFANFGNAWIASHVFAIGSQITDSNGNLQQVTAVSGSGTSGANPPIWAITTNSTTIDNSGGNQITWTNMGPNGLSAKTGYQYYAAFLDSVTGQPSNVSPISVSTGLTIGQQITISGTGSLDPQVDSIAIYRNVDGGAFFYQLAVIANPGARTWTFNDTIQDSGLNTSVWAPIGLLNSPPPVGLKGMEFHASRLWGFSGTNLFYAAGPDNAALLNVVLNAVSAESWPPLNSIPFDATIVRVLSTQSGLLVFTTKDIWIVLGSDLSTFFPYRLFKRHGIRSYNMLDADGSNVIIYLADRQFVSINPSSGVIEFGFPVGDVLEKTFDPSLGYVARHVSGSQDNCIFLANGSSSWYRLNPNQVGASLSGEQSPVWSPLATVNQGNIGAVASIEVAPGIRKLLVGQTTVGPVLVRDINTFTDNGSAFTWSATIGSIILATVGTEAETESVSVESLQAIPGVAVLLDEISGPFETLTKFVPDPTNLLPSSSLNSNRWYLSQGTVPPLCRHMQIQLSGAATATKDEILSVQVRGALVAEAA